MTQFVRVDLDQVAKSWPRNDLSYKSDFARALEDHTSHGCWSALNSRLSFARVSFEGTFRIMIDLALSFFALIGTLSCHMGSRKFLWYNLKMLGIDTGVTIGSVLGIVSPTFGLSVKNTLTSYFSPIKTDRDGREEVALMHQYIPHSPLEEVSVLPDEEGTSVASESSFSSKGFQRRHLLGDRKRALSRPSSRGSHSATPPTSRGALRKRGRSASKGKHHKTGWKKPLSKAGESLKAGVYAVTH